MRRRGGDAELEATGLQFSGVFGARSFFIKNLKIRKLGDTCLVDFGEPDAQSIPDIGVSDISE